ncbi:protein PYRICULARIA ORYZAE RESISTANCE 21-like [Abrus precatorius]|uniref:Protein PYRICULARIA ORYZAE RESISTANCE 21-like n=1 Tax=Abrus precatorius TaxID=3816 RepID=A0A8B8LDC9_ABRPR|nr:protein PYRICULARIA ORYZAE RESISTANCE 21-like [Abrus precatorius]
MEEKVAIMKLKVDLQCRKCIMKLKKVLSKFPQIRDQVYDEKNGVVTIRVICCNPERLRNSICCEGGGSIKSIEIVEPPKPKPPPKKPEEPKPPPPGPPEPPKQDRVPPPPPPSAAKFSEPPPFSVLAFPPPSAPVGPFYGGGPGGPPGFYARPIYDSYGWSGPCYVGPHHECCFEEEASVCTIN